MNFLIYYRLFILSPLHPISLCLEEIPATKNQPPEAKTKPDSPSASPLLPEENSLKKKIPSGFVFIQGPELSGKMEIFYAPKLLMEQKVAGLLVFHAALFILKEEFLQGVVTGHVLVFNFRKSVKFPEGGKFPIDEQKLSLLFILMLSGNF